VNCAAPVGRSRCLPMRDLDTFDSELRLLAAVRWSIREHGGEPSSRQVDELLDERAELTGSYTINLPAGTGGASTASGGWRSAHAGPDAVDIYVTDPDANTIAVITTTTINYNITLGATSVAIGPPATSTCVLPTAIRL
jgi:hypothetical protein